MKARSHGSIDGSPFGSVLLRLLALVCSLFLTLITHDARIRAIPIPCNPVRLCPNSSYCKKYAKGTCTSQEQIQEQVQAHTQSSSSGGRHVSQGEQAVAANLDWMNVRAGLRARS